jgi:hypothetical protein
VRRLRCGAPTPPPSTPTKRAMTSADQGLAAPVWDHRRIARRALESSAALAATARLEVVAVGSVQQLDCCVVGRADLRYLPLTVNADIIHSEGRIRIALGGSLWLVER